MRRIVHVKNRVGRGFASGKRLSLPCWLAVCLLISTVLLGMGLSQNPPAPPKISSDDIIQFLNKTVDWYHQTAVEQEIANEPADVTFVDADRRVASQVVQQAFDFARQQAQSATSNPMPIRRKLPETLQANTSRWLGLRRRPTSRLSRPKLSSTT